VDGDNHTILRQDVNLSRLVCLFRHVLMLRRRKEGNFGVSGACETLHDEVWEVKEEIDRRLGGLIVSLRYC
jgi:hypothetical protein